MRVLVDRENVNDEFVIVRKLHKQHGATVAADELVLDIETSKTITEIRAPGSGVLSLTVQVGDEIPVGALLFEVGSGRAAVANATVERAATTPPEAVKPSQQGKLSRSAAAKAESLGVDPARIRTQGWVTAADVLAETGAKPRPAVASALIVDSDADSRTLPKAAFRRERTAMRKRAEARTLSLANSDGTTSMISSELVLKGPRLVAAPFLFQDTVADLVVFEGSRLLKRYPELNAFHVDERTVGYFEQVNIGISFDSGRNLKVLALCAAESLTLGEAQGEFQRLLDLYESEQPIEERLLSTSTMTISDLSRSSAESMLPLLNGRQSMIIGITHPAPDRYRFFAAFDHRVSEGLQVARFLRELCDRVQSHYRPASGAVSTLRCSVCDQSMHAELQVGGSGLLRIAKPDGSDGYLCRNCFRGW